MFVIIFILPQQGDPPTADVILIKDEDDIEGCGAVTGENMHQGIFHMKPYYECGNKSV